MPIIHDIWQNEVDVTPAYVSHRNRTLSARTVLTLQVKGKRVLVNTYGQNVGVPTMCIFFDNNEKANDAYRLMMDTLFTSAGTKDDVIVPTTPPDEGTHLVSFFTPLLLGFFLYTNFFMAK